MTWIALAGGLLLGLAAGWVVGSRGARERYGQAVLRASRRIRSRGASEADDGPEGAAEDRDPPELLHLLESLRSGWVPMHEARQEAVDRALERIHRYLRQGVELPLLEGLERSGDELVSRANRALDSLEDLKFFLAGDEVRDLQPHNLVTLLQEVTKEWTQEFDAPLTFTAEAAVLRARVAPDAFKDALYLVLVNAGRFGGGETVEVVAETGDDTVRIRVRDRGQGFSPDALERGLEPLFTTEEGALGLGLSHSRRVVRAMGGRIRLRNRDGGGGEVEITLPQA